MCSGRVAPASHQGAALMDHFLLLLDAHLQRDLLQMDSAAAKTVRSPRAEMSHASRCVVRSGVRHTLSSCERQRRCVARVQSVSGSSLSPSARCFRNVSRRVFRERLMQCYSYQPSSVT